MTRRIRVARFTAAAAMTALAATSLLGTPAHAAAPVDACVLNPSASQSALTEERSCFSVGVRLSRALAVGEQGALTFTVRAAAARDGVAVRAELPPNLRWVTRPAGMSPATRVSRAPHLRGTLQAAATSRAFAAGQSITYTGVVQAVTAGPAEIAVTATADASRATETAADRVFLTVGSTAAVSRFGIAVNRQAGTAPYQGAAPKPLVAAAKQKQVTVRGASPAPQARAALSPGGRACAKGTWNYTDKTGVGRPGISWRVEAWDRDTTGGDDLLASSLTGFSGEYNLCFDNTDDATLGQDVYMKFIADNGTWRVQTAGNWTYNYASGVKGEVRDGTTADFGWLQPGDPTHMRAAAAFAATQVTWNNIPGACWDMIGACRAVVILWQPDSTDGTYYSLAGNNVHLKAIDPDSAHTVSHEVTHSIMDDVYEDAYPATPNCNPHNIPAVSSAGCAWTEGFAEWLPAVVFRDPSYRWPNGSSLNLETPTWGTAGWSNGPTVEGRVAGALIDLYDTNNEGTDRWSEDMSVIWSTFQNHVSGNLSAFWSHRRADGFNVSNSPLGSFYQNTINFGFAG